MTRRVYIEAALRLIIDVEENVEVSDVVVDAISRMITTTDSGGDIVDASLIDWFIIDSK